MTETPGGQTPPEQLPAAEPFAPQPRPPRTPWVNPARRGGVAGVAVTAAIVLFGAGFGIGWASSGGGGAGRSHPHHHGVEHFQPYPGRPPVAPGQIQPRHRDQRPNQAPPATPAKPRPTPARTG